MKKYLGIFVVMLALVSSAFTVNHKNVKLAGNSYTYDLYGQSGQDDIVNLSDPENYSPAGTSPLSCPAGTAHRCGVENATDDGSGHPDLTQSFSIRKRN